MFGKTDIRHQKKKGLVTQQHNQTQNYFGEVLHYEDLKMCHFVVDPWAKGGPSKIGRKKRFHSCICNFMVGKYSKSEEKNLPEAQFGSNSGRNLLYKSTTDFII